jgi:uncharacterized membrane protein YeiH
MFDSVVTLLDWLGIVVFALTGALVASRNQMDLVGFVLLSTVTGIGGGTLRDLLLDIHPIFWIEKPAYVMVCGAVALIAFFTVHHVQSRYRLILWLDAAGLALFAATGAERAVGVGVHSIIAVGMGIITACFGGIIRDMLSQERSIVFSYEIYVTAALLASTAFVAANALSANREIAVSVAFLLGLALRGGAIKFGWSLPRYRAQMSGQD